MRSKTSKRSGKRLTAAVDVAEQRFPEANTLYGRFDAEFQKAQDAVKQAETERRVAERRFAQ